MKRILFSLMVLVSVMLNFGCSSDTKITEIEKEINKAPIIESLTFGNDAELGNRVIYSRNVFGLNQKVIVRAKVTDPENDPISLSWSSGSNDFGKGQELELMFGRVGSDIGVTVKDTDDKNNSTSITKTISVIECDFGFGLWGDELEIIKESETGVYMGTIINAEHMHRYVNEGNWYYKFSDNKLYSGLYQRIYTPKVLQPTQFEIAWVLYEEKLNELIVKYGDFTKQESSRSFSGVKKDDGLSLINGATIDTYFDNERTKIHYRVHLPTEAITVVYDVTYSKK